MLQLLCCNRLTKKEEAFRGANRPDTCLDSPRQGIHKLLCANQLRCPARRVVCAVVNISLFQLLNPSPARRAQSPYRYNTNEKRKRDGRKINKSKISDIIRCQTSNRRSSRSLPASPFRLSPCSALSMPSAARHSSNAQLPIPTHEARKTTVCGAWP